MLSAVLSPNMKFSLLYPLQISNSLCCTLPKYQILSAVFSPNIKCSLLYPLQINSLCSTSPKI
jgi:hypothetical protein